jgi:hypothetical protein
MNEKKLVSLNNLDKLSKKLNVRYEEMIQEKSDRAMAEIEITKNMLDGKSIKYVTQAEYDNLSDAEKNNNTVAYFITDAVDLSHEHENKEFLDNLAARNIAIGNKSQSFDGINDLVYTIEDIGASPAVHNHDDLYYTETEIDEKIEVVNDGINELDAKLETVDALTLNGYSIWVGTTEELEAITERDSNTLYFEISDETSDDDVVQVDISNGVLQLTTNKYQKTTMVTGTEIVFPIVNKFTEIHLYFDAETDMDLNFPDCRWRVDPNIEAGKSYEIVATYNTMQWLVNVIVYS